MWRKYVILSAAGILSLAWASEAKAQAMPFIDLNGMAQQNIAFGQYMDQRAWHTAWSIARQLPPGYRVQFNMPAWQQSMQGYQGAADRYIHSMQKHSQVRSAAVYNWGQAFLGNAYYSAPGSGSGYYLPWMGPAYNINPFGQATPGARWDRGFNVYAR